MHIPYPFPNPPQNTHPIWQAALQAALSTNDTAEFHLRKRLQTNTPSLAEGGPLTIAVVGDSVSQGCFYEPVRHDYHAVYHNQLRLMIQADYPEIPVNVINAAVGGVTAPYGLAHFETRVVSHSPDLVILCFGLNDINAPLSDYTNALSGLFDACKAHRYDAIFLTPNMLNSYRSQQSPKQYWEYAAKTAAFQQDGTMDRYMDAARACAKSHNIPVCDAYAVWKEMERQGIDTTSLLVNRINHPSQEMHFWFAALLNATLFGKLPLTHENVVGTDGMYR